MKFLIDTNVFIPLEPTVLADVEESLPSVARLNRLAQTSGHQLYLHRVQLQDIDRDANADRRRLRKMLFDKYPRIDDPPSASSDIVNTIEVPRQGTNDWVDYHMLVALQMDAVDFLITEDQRLHKMGARLGLQNRIVAVADAVALIERLSDRVPTAPPAAQSVRAYNLDEKDPLFDSFRQDYPHFDHWLTKCKREHRPAWRILMDSGHLAGVCIVKAEEPGTLGLAGKLLKICSFKVSEKYSGYKFGELLLKAVFGYAHENSFDQLFITVFEKYGGLIDLLGDFGFQRTGLTTHLGEIVLAKPMRFTEEEKNSHDPLSFNVRYGPFAVKTTDVPFFIVPIKPRYHRLLFPEAESQLELIPGSLAFGNSIRKAYLSNARVKSIPRGANLLFYRSEDSRSLTCLGVAEDSIVSSSAIEVAKYVGKRTLYSLKDIERFASRPILAVLFRLSRVFKTPIPFYELQQAGALSAPPQSIVRIPKEVEPWIADRLDT